MFLCSAYVNVFVVGMWPVSFCRSLAFEDSHVHFEILAMYGQPPVVEDGSVFV